MCTQVAGQKVIKVLGAEELSPSTKLVQVLLLRSVSSNAATAARATAAKALCA
jgi:hypothetical protein